MCKISFTVFTQKQSFFHVKYYFLCRHNTFLLWNVNTCKKCVLLQKQFCPILYFFSSNKWRLYLKNRLFDNGHTSFKSLPHAIIWIIEPFILLYHNSNSNFVVVATDIIYSSICPCVTGVFSVAFFYCNISYNTPMKWGERERERVRVCECMRESVWESVAIKLMLLWPPSLFSSLSLKAFKVKVLHFIETVGWI